jgi:16S rRNA (guanine1516-N2)-methyltransferase
MEPGFQEWRVAVTTPLQSKVTSAAQARKLCFHFDLPYVDRHNLGIRPLLEAESLDAVVVAHRDPKVYHRDNPEVALFFHPGMASQRMLLMQRGQPDRLLSLCQIQPGDVILDATLGLGTDSLVFAMGVGPSGRVLGVEHVHVLYQLLSYAKASGVPAYPGIGDLFARIELHHRHHLDFLKAQPAEAVDVVYFDPMFELPAESAGIGPLRPFADASALSEASFLEACRVCRRMVVVKERPHSALFYKLGLRADIENRRFAYGVWRK